eukprot:gene17094-7143_t
MFFGPNSRTRLLATQVVAHRWFARLISVVISLSCVALLLPPSTMTWNLDLAITSCFAAEAVVKILALGFVCGSGAYLHSGWNVLDFLILLLVFVSYFDI